MKYWAFLSYSHTDKKWGDWLHKALETYRVPRRLVGTEARGGRIPQRLFPIFRDREELPVSADLGANINEALKESRYLIVICSPRSAQSRWVGEEINTFKKLGREDRILALIVDGEPNASDGKPGFNVEDECFHEAMRYRTADGELSEVRTEPIAADVREGKDGKTDAKLKLIAGLLGVNYDDLKQREQERRRRRARVIATFAVFLVTAFGALASWAIIAAKQVTRQQVANDIGRAQELFDQNNAAGAVLYLARAAELDSAEHSVAADRFWFSLTQRSWPLPLSSPMRHKAGILSACFSPDGQKVVTASRDKTARIWDANSGQQLGQSLQHPRLVRAAMFTPNSELLVTIGFDGIARIWDASSGQKLSITIKHNDSINSVAISFSGKWLATGSADGMVRVSELVKGQTIAEVRHRENVHTLAFDPVDETVLLSVSGKAATLWKLPNGRRLFDLPHQEQVNSAEFSPDGKRVLTASDDHLCRVWDVVSGQVIAEFEHETEVRSAFFNSNGAVIACLAGDKVVIWSGKGEPGQKHVFSHQRRVTCAHFSPDNLVLFSGTEGGVVQAWDLRVGKTLGEPIREDSPIVSINLDKTGKKLLVTTGKASTRVWRSPARNPLAWRFAHKAAVESIALSSDGRMLLSASNDETANLWSLQDFRQRPQTLAHTGAVLCGVFSPDSKYALTGTADGKACLWHTAPATRAGDPVDHTAAVSQVVFSRDGASCATATERGLAQFWDLTTRKPLGKVMNHDVRISDIDLSRDGSLFLTAGSGPKIELWDSHTGELRADALRAPKEVTFAHFCPSRDFVAAAASDGTVYFWSTSTFKSIRQTAVGSAGVSAFAFSPDGRAFAAAAGEIAVIHDVSSGHQIGESIRQASPVTSLRFSADSKRIATGTDDGTVRLWDAFSGLPLTEQLQHGENIRDLRFSPSGRTLFVCSRGRAVKAWDVDVDLGRRDRKALAQLAQTISPFRINEAGQLEAREVEPIELLRAVSTKFSAPVRLCAEWLLAEPINRALTPHSKENLNDYIYELTQENDQLSRDEAVFFADNDETMLRLIASKSGTGSQ